MDKDKSVIKYTIDDMLGARRSGNLELYHIIKQWFKDEKERQWKQNEKNLINHDNKIKDFLGICKLRDCTEPQLEDYSLCEYHRKQYVEMRERDKQRTRKAKSYLKNNYEDIKVKKVEPSKAECETMNETTYNKLPFVKTDRIPEAKAGGNTGGLSQMTKDCIEEIKKLGLGEKIVVPLTDFFQEPKLRKKIANRYQYAFTTAQKYADKTLLIAQREGNVYVEVLAFGYTKKEKQKE